VNSVGVDRAGIVDMGWRGHYDLVKLNVHHPEVTSHLFDAVRTWVQQFDIDRLRLDVADVLDLEFQREPGSRKCTPLVAPPNIQFHS
jgi:glycosidase